MNLVMDMSTETFRNAIRNNVRLSPKLPYGKIMQWGYSRPAISDAATFLWVLTSIIFGVNVRHSADLDIDICVTIFSRAPKFEKEQIRRARKIQSNYNVIASLPAMRMDCS